MCVCVCVCSCMNAVPASSTLAGFCCSSHWPGCECKFCEGTQMPVGKKQNCIYTIIQMFGAFLGAIFKRSLLYSASCIYLIKDAVKRKGRAMTCGQVWCPTLGIFALHTHSSKYWTNKTISSWGFGVLHKGLTPVIVLPTITASTKTWTWDLGVTRF